MKTDPFILLKRERRDGKTTIAVEYALMYAKMYGGDSVLFISPNMNESTNVARSRPVLVANGINIRCLDEIDLVDLGNASCAIIDNIDFMTPSKVFALLRTMLSRQYLHIVVTGTPSPRFTMIDVLEQFDLRGLPRRIY